MMNLDQVMASLPLELSNLPSFPQTSVEDGRLESSNG